MVNKVTLIGNLGKDPEIRRLENGTAVASFSVATTESYKDTSGEWKNLTEWHNIVVWRGGAEYCEKYLKKGSMVYIEGKITTRKYTDKDGIERFTTEIVANTCRLLEKKESNEQQQNNAPSVQTPVNDVFKTAQVSPLLDLPQNGDEFKNKTSGVKLYVDRVDSGLIYYTVDGKPYQNTYAEWADKILPKVDKITDLPF